MENNAKLNKSISVKEKQDIKNWFFKLSDKEFNNVIKLTNQNMLVLIINLVSTYKETKNDWFKIKKSDDNLFFKKIFKNNANNIIEIHNCWEFSNSNETENKVENEFLKSIRVCTYKHLFDSLIIFNNNRNFIWKMFEEITHNKFLNLDINLIENFRSKKIFFNIKNIPSWINFYEYNTIAKIILSFFEFNIIKNFYKKKFENNEYLNIQNPIKDNLNIYNSLTEKDRLNIIEKILNNDFIECQKINIRVENININYLKIIKIKEKKNVFKLINNVIKNCNKNKILEMIYYPNLIEFCSFECIILGVFGQKINELKFQNLLFNIQECKSESYDLEKIVSSSSNDYSNNISDSYGSNKKNRNKSIQKFKKKSIIYIPKINIKNKKKQVDIKIKKKEVNNEKKEKKNIKKIEHINAFDEFFNRRTNSVFNKNLEKINESTLSVRNLENEETQIKNSEVVSKSFKTRTFSTKESSLCNKLFLLKKKPLKNPSEISFNVTPEKTSIKNNINEDEFFSTIKSNEENKNKIKIKPKENLNVYYNKGNNCIKLQNTEAKKHSFKKLFNVKQKTSEFKFTNYNEKDSNLIKERLNSKLIEKNNQNYFFRQLDKEIWNKIGNINKIIELNKNSNWEAVNLIKRNIISSLNNNIQIYTFGSFETNLMTINSDIDLLIVFNFDNKKIFLDKIASILKKIPIVKNIHTILSATVPVIKIETINKNNTSTKIDIIVDKTDNTTALKSTLYVKQCIRKFKNFKNLYLILKNLIQEYNFMNSYLGGINSYGLAILVSLFLNMNDLNDNEHISLNVYKFCEFFSLKVDFKIHIINPFVDRSYPISFKSNNFINNDLVILDPTLKFEKNIISNCYWINKIQLLFLNICEEINVLKNHVFRNINNSKRIKTWTKNHKQINIKNKVEKLKLNSLNFLI